MSGTANGGRSIELYQLNSDEFDLAIELLKDWRIDCFYVGKAKAFDSATRAKNLS